MRSGPVYERTWTVGEPAEGLYHAAGVSNGDHRVNVHSKVSKYAETPLPEIFLDTLRSFTNQNMWDLVYLDNNGEWMSEATLNGTLNVEHDASYQPETRKDVCSTAVWVQCRAPKKHIFDCLLC